MPIIFLLDNNNRETIITLPSLEQRTVYRIAVALGEKKEFPLEACDFGNGFVYVFDEESTFTVFNKFSTGFIRITLCKFECLDG